VQNLANRPFALIGVHALGREPAELKRVMDKERLNLRSFGDQAIGARWNNATPAYYVIDPRGVIRHKWVGNPGAKTIESALDKLIDEAERR
jgi:hypothetical protein